MAENALVQQISQIGLEATPGTVAAAFSRINALTFEPQPAGQIDVFRPDGYKFATVAAPGMEWATFKLSGVPCFRGLEYLLQCLYGKVASPATVSTTGKKWQHDVSSTTEDLLQTLSIQHGSALRARQYLYGLLGELTLEFARDGLKLDGAGIAQAVADNTALASATEVGVQPILAKYYDLWIDPTSGALGTTKMLRGFNVKVKVSDKFAPVWALDSSKPSYAASVEAPIKSEVTILLEVDATSMAFLSTYERAGATMFVQLKALGPQIGAGPAVFTHMHQMAVKINKVHNYKAYGQVYAVEYGGEIMHDPTWGKALSAYTINDLASL